MTDMTSDLWHTLECECNPGFKYANYKSFANHFDSKRHDYYEILKSQREMKIKIGNLENARIRDIREREETIRKLRKDKIFLFRKYHITEMEKIKNEKKHDSKRILELWILKMIHKRRLERLSFHWHKINFNQCLFHLKEKKQYQTTIENCHNIIENLYGQIEC
jgi:hypothetical protein